MGGPWKPPPPPSPLRLIPYCDKNVYHLIHFWKSFGRGRGGYSQGYGIGVLECSQDFGVAPKVWE